MGLAKHPDHDCVKYIVQVESARVFNGDKKLVKGFVYRVMCMFCGAVGMMHSRDSCLFDALLTAESIEYVK